jgi:pimeloyl-ACP methyl ester carboxylesterase
MGSVLVGTLLLLATAGAIYQRVGARQDAQRLPPPGRLVDIGGRRLHLYCLGDGPFSVVFEAGLAASSLSWRPVQEAIARDMRGCAYDRAGYGWSDPAAGPLTARASAADLHRLLQAAGVSPPYILVGHSFGAYVVSAFAAEHAASVAGIVLVDPLTAQEWLSPSHTERRRASGGRLFSYIGAAIASVGIVRFLLNRQSAGSTGLPAAVLGAFGREADSVVRRIVGEVAKLPRELWPAVQAHWSRAAAFRALAKHFGALESSAAEVQAALAPGPDGACPLRDIPVIVVSAANSAEDRLRGHLVLAELSRCGTHMRATTGGHWIHLDQPSIVIEAIRRLIPNV